MKNNILVTVAFLMVAVSSARSQQADSTLRQALSHTLDSMFLRLGVNGISAAMQFADETLWTGYNGVSTFSPIDSITPEHIFETGSTTKTITAMCILQLHDEGVISLDDSLHRWLPAYQHIDSTITIRQLLKHQSGIADLLLNPVFQPTLLQDPSRHWTADEAIRNFLLPPVFAPGTSWSYSNTNYIVMGMIIEESTGMTFDEVLKERFFSPMGLNSFINPAVDTIRDPYAHLWLDTNGDGVLDDAGPLITTWYSLFSIIGPPGGYFATARDLAKWIRKSMQGSLVQASTWQAALETVPTNLPNGIKYGFGIMESTFLGLQALGHGGDLSYSTQAQYFPAFDLSIVVTCNDASITSWNLISTVRALLQTYIDRTNMSSISHPKQVERVRVSTFPNPFSNETNVQINAPRSLDAVSISVFDVAGNHVIERYEDIEPGTNTFNIHLGNERAAGMYFLVVKHGPNLIKHDTIFKN